jgi:hypothetical protein
MSVGRVFQNFKVKISQFLARNGRLVRSGIVLKKQDTFRKPKTYQHSYVYTTYARERIWKEAVVI